MTRYKDIKGQRFGNLVAVEKTEMKKNTSWVWRCVCDCGNEHTVSVNYLTTGSCKSCGCLQHKGRPKDISGKKFNKLLAVESTGEKSKNGDFIWLCECECGNKAEFPVGQLQSDSAYSCGCENRGGKHKMTGTPTYRSWSKMLARVRMDEYAEWHGDVTVCDRWDTYKGGSFENFYEDMGERPEGFTLNRINGAKIYSPDTCEWASLSLQSFDQKRNKHNLSGRTGVRFREDRQKWEAFISKGNEQVRLYYGDSFEEACKKREEAELKYYGFTKE